MNGSIRPLVISRPCAHPNSPPRTNASTMPMAMIVSGAKVCPPTPADKPFISQIMLPAINAAIDPTDRSMPPEIITNVSPTAMMPMNEGRVSTFIRLSTVAKSWLSKVPVMHSTRRPTSGPSPYRWCARRMARPDWAASVGGGRMSDHLLFGQVIEIERGLQASRAHHGDAMAQSDQLNQFG